MAKNRLTRKELREPDPLIRWTNEAWRRMEPHLVRIGAGVAALVVVLVCGGAVSAWLDHRAEKASALFGDAIGAEQAEVGDTATPPDPAEKDKAGAPAFKTETEKLQAVAQKLRDLAASYRRTGVADQSRLALGSALLRLGDLAGAQSAYETYIKDASSSDPLLAFAHEGLGFVYEAQKRYPDAMAELDKIAPTGATAFYRDHALYEHARVQERLGEKAGAIATYKEILDLPGSGLRQVAQERVAELEAE